MSQLIGLLLRHVVLLVVVALVVVGVINRETIFGLQPEAGSAAQIGVPVPSATAPGDGPQPSTPAAPATKPAPQQQRDEALGQGGSTAPDATMPGVPSKPETRSDAGEAKPHPPAGQTQPSAEALPGAVEGSNDTPSDAAAGQGSNTAQSGEQPSGATSPEYRFRPMRLSDDDDAGQTIDDARRAYWSGDTKAAITLYQGLVQDAPDDARVRGELGSMYYQSGRLPEAAAEFQAAAALLIERRAVADARRMIDALAAVDPEHARRLQRQLATKVER